MINFLFEEVEKAFYEFQQIEQKSLKKKQRTTANKTIYVYKNSLTVHLSEEVYNAVAKRAKKNMLTPEEQVEDIAQAQYFKKLLEELGDT